MAGDASFSVRPVASMALVLVVGGCGAGKEAVLGPGVVVEAPAPTVQEGSPEQVNQCPCSLRWSLNSVPGVRVNTAAAASHGAIWLSGGSNLYRSTDGGRHFSEVPLELNHLYADHVLEPGEHSAMVKRLWARGRSVYVMSDYQLFAGDELGTRWRRLAAPTRTWGHEMVAPSMLESLWGTEDSLFYLENIGRVFLSTDDGAHFREVPEVGRMGGMAFLNITGNEAGYLYINDGAGRVISSPPDSKAWRFAQAGSEVPKFHSRVVAGPQAVALAYDKSGLVRTSDGGATWSALATSRPIRTLAAGPHPGDWSAQAQGAMLRSLDDGASWSEEALVAVRGDTAANDVLEQKRLASGDIWRWSCGGYALGYGKYPGTDQVDLGQVYFARATCDEGAR